MARCPKRSTMVCYLQQPRHRMLNSDSITLDLACDNTALSDDILEILKDDVVACLKAMARRGQRGTLVSVAVGREGDTCVPTLLFSACWLKC
jgi:hypothetical protein